MSIRVMSMVWDAYPGGGSDLLALLALADWSDDEGRCWPSMASIAKKTRLSEKQARRVVHSIIEAGHLAVIDNQQGGAMSRRYQIRLDRLTPPASVTPPADGSPPAHVHNPSRPREATPPADGSRTIIDTSLTVRDAEQALSPVARKSKKGEITLAQFLENCKASGQQSIPADDPIWEYAQKVGITDEMIAAAWGEFKAAYLTASKRYRDWRHTFRNAVRLNWYKLWFIGDGQAAAWTTAGEQARRAAA